jgi:hypothetical protein
MLENIVMIIVLGQGRIQSRHAYISTTAAPLALNGELTQVDDKHLRLSTLLLDKHYTAMRLTGIGGGWGP